MSNIFLIISLFFFITGAIGIWRLPDPVSRLHSGGLGDTLGLWFLLLAIIWGQGDFALIIKLIFLGLMVLIINPVISHLLARTEKELLSEKEGRM